MKRDVFALFAQPLVDLGRDDARFAYILTPESALGAAKRGVTAQFLDNAAQYHAAYVNHDYFAALIGNALAALDSALRVDVILDIGSGSGNSVFPLLERFPDAFIVATDISPQLLAILRDELRARGQDDRVALVCMDASTNPYRSGVFDLAVGAAVLHHIIEPDRVIRACERALRPGGAALFFEPFETGQGLLNLAYGEILRDAERRGERSPAIQALRQMHEDHATRIDPGDRIDLMDDKWMFTRGYFESLARAGDWSECRITPIHGDASPLIDQTRTNLKLSSAQGGDLPRWAWAILERYEASFTSRGRRDMPLEAAIVMRRGELVTHDDMGGRVSGWWWNPAEPGRGFFIDAHDQTLRIAACLYDDAGAPVWYAAGPSRMASDVVLQAASCLGRHAAPATVRVRFDGDSRAALTWADAHVALQPQHADVAAFRSSAWDNMTGWWVDEHDPPQAMVLVENLDTRIVAALLTRDEWCITVAERDHARQYEGQWLRFRGGQTMTSPYRAPAAPQVLGASRIIWADMSTLVLTRADGRRCLMRRANAS